MQVPNRCLMLLSDAFRQRRNSLRTRWRRLAPGQQALLVVAHLRKGETYRDLADCFGIGTSTVYRYLREGLELLAAMGPTLDEAIAVAQRKAYVILDGTLLRINRSGMTGGRDRPYYSGKHKCHGVNVQVIADPAGRLVWVSPALPGSRHDIVAAREHGILDAIDSAGVHTVADTGYQGAGPNVAVPQRRRRIDPDTGGYRRLSETQKEVNTAHARQRGPGERVNGQLKSWKILRKIRASPSQATTLV